MLRKKIIQFERRSLYVKQKDLLLRKKKLYRIKWTLFIQSATPINPTMHNKAEENLTPITTTGNMKVQYNLPTGESQEAVQTKKVKYPYYIDTKNMSGIDCRIIHAGPRTKHEFPCPEKFDVVYVYTVNEAIIMLEPYFKKPGFQFLVTSLHSLKMCGYAKQAFTRHKGNGPICAE